jgi:histidyl-tRNA synthetase
MPELGHVVDDVVLALEDHLKAPAAMVAAHLRNAGRVVDLVLATKRLKWVFKHTERLHAKRLVLLGATEWNRGTLRVKDLNTREESDVTLDDLLT